MLEGYQMNNIKSGVYKIVNIINNKIYIGSSINVVKRKSQHFSEFRNNTHKNPYFQKSFNKYGEENFKFEVIEFVEDKTKLVECEQYWIDFYQSFKSEYGYNLNPVASNCLGTVRSKETREKMSRSKKELLKNGVTFSEEHLQHLRKPRNKTLENLSEKEKEEFLVNYLPVKERPKKAKKEKQKVNNKKIMPRKLDESKVIEIKKLLSQNVNQSIIAEMFNVSSKHISQINTNKKWKHIKLDNYNEMALTS